MARPSTHPAVYVIRGAALVAVAFSAALMITYFTRDTTFCGPEGGCHAVARAFFWTVLLPPLGMVAYTVVFATSLFTGKLPLRITAAMALLGAAAGITFLVLQGVVIGELCSLCVGTDSAAVVAGLAGAWILKARAGEPEGSTTILSLWWAPYSIALFGPFVLAFSLAPGVPAEVRALFDDDADVNIVEMVDFECPHCRALHPVLREVVEESEHDVHLARIVVPLHFHTHARDASKAYYCAGDRSEEMADRIFAAEDLTVDGLRELATELGMDPEEFDACLEDEATEARVVADEDRAEAAGMQGLPTVYVGEEVFLGFSEEQGPATYRAAVNAAASGEQSRVRLWPGGMLLVALLLAVVTGRQKREVSEEDDDNDDNGDNGDNGEDD